MEDEVKKLREITNELSELLEQIKLAAPHHEQSQVVDRIKKLTNIVIFSILLSLTIGLGSLALVITHVYFP